MSFTLNNPNESGNGTSGQNGAAFSQHCSMELLNSLGVKANSNLEQYESKICPGQDVKCCGKSDDDDLAFLWKKTSYKRIYAYYKAYEYMISLLWGYTDEINNIAKNILEYHSMYTYDNNNAERKESFLSGLKYKFKDEKLGKCREYAIQFSKIEYNYNKVRTLVSSVNTTFKYLGNLRKAFPCFICTGTGKANTYVPFSTYFNFIYNKRFYLSTAFCQDLVKNSFSNVMMIREYFYNYIQFSSKLFSCITSNKEEADEGQTTKVESLLKSNKMWSISYRSCEKGISLGFLKYECEDYCQNFNMAQASPDFEGDLEETKVYYDNFMKYTHIFKTPRKNKIVLEITDTKYLIDYYFKRSSPFFYKSIRSFNKFMNFKTDVTAVGFDLHTYALNSQLYFYYKSTKIISLICIFAFILA